MPEAANAFRGPRLRIGAAQRFCEGGTVRTSSYMVFSAFNSTTDARYLGWKNFRGQLEPSFPVGQSSRLRENERERATPAGRGQWGIWRLLAPNSRELARSSYLYGSFASARTHFLELQAMADDLAVTIFIGPRSTMHGWYATRDDGLVMMTTARWYEGSSASRSAAVGTISALREARLPDDGGVTMRRTTTLEAQSS